jgi:hypothetical protein
MSKQSSKCCPLNTLTGTYVSVGTQMPTTTLTIRPAPGKAATGSSKWIDTEGSHFGELQGQVRKMGDGQSPAQGVWYGTCRVDGGEECHPFVLVAREDGKGLHGAYLTAGSITWEFKAID